MSEKVREREREQRVLRVLRVQRERWGVLRRIPESQMSVDLGWLVTLVTSDSEASAAERLPAAQRSPGIQVQGLRLPVTRIAMATNLRRVPILGVTGWDRDGPGQIRRQPGSRPGPTARAPLATPYLHARACV